MSDKATVSVFNEEEICTIVQNIKRDYEDKWNGLQKGLKFLNGTQYKNYLMFMHVDDKNEYNKDYPIYYLYHEYPGFPKDMNESFIVFIVKIKDNNLSCADDDWLDVQHYTVNETDKETMDTAIKLIAESLKS